MVYNNKYRIKPLQFIGTIIFLIISIKKVRLKKKLALMPFLRTSIEFDVVQILNIVYMPVS